MHNKYILMEKLMKKCMKCQGNGQVSQDGRGGPSQKSLDRKVAAGVSREGRCRTLVVKVSMKKRVCVPWAIYMLIRLGMSYVGVRGRVGRKKTNGP